MHAFVRKGLMLSATTGTLVMGYAGTAAAQDSATALGAALVGARDNDCWTGDATAKAVGFASDSPGAISGNVGSVAANAPVQACGLAGGAVSAEVAAQGNDCVDEGTHALAKGAASDSPGLVSGNVLQAPVDAPVQACGDSVALLGFGTGAEGNHCVNGGPETAPPPVPCPPPTNPCPPPPPNPCPPPAHTWGPDDHSAQTADDSAPLMQTPAPSMQASPAV